jgi:hypothetical protein
MLHNRQTQQKEEQEENVNRWRVHVHTCKNGRKKIFGLANGYEELLLLWQKKRICNEMTEIIYMRRENIENMEGIISCKKTICNEMTENIYRGERISKIWKE